MPRKSAEARGAILHRSGVNPPQPPRNLGQPAGDHWATVVQSRAADFFDGSVQGLLGNYCSALAQADRVAAAMVDEPVGTPHSSTLTKDYATMIGIAMSLARALRLTKQSATRSGNGEHTERGIVSDPLIGGVLPFRRP